MTLDWRHAVVGWDVGGAHVKACVLQAGEVVAAVQWPCPLWLGLDRLEAVLVQARARWPGMGLARHALTMTGEMADLFSDRRQGVVAITNAITNAITSAITSAHTSDNTSAVADTTTDTKTDALPQAPHDQPVDPLNPLNSPRPDHPSGPPQVAVFCGPDDWCTPAQAGERWADIASANWLATAHLAAQRVGDGVLVDIGSTTTDLIVLRGGRVAQQGRTDHERLASGELVYQGVVRTPLCALAPRVVWRGQCVNVMNEFFATTADVYRLSGDLCAAHDQQPAADNGPKTETATSARLARMVGLDAADGSPADWQALAAQWRSLQVADIAGQLVRVARVAHAPVLAGVASAQAPGATGPQPSPAGAVVVAAGCGAFLVPEVLAAAGLADLPVWRFGRDVARCATGMVHSGTLAEHGTGLPDLANVSAWAEVCAPAVAVAALLHAAEATVGATPRPSPKEHA